MKLFSIPIFSILCLVVLISSAASMPSASTLKTQLYRATGWRELVTVSNMILESYVDGHGLEGSDSIGEGIDSISLKGMEASFPTFLSAREAAKEYLIRVSKARTRGGSVQFRTVKEITQTLEKRKLDLEAIERSIRDALAANRFDWQLKDAGENLANPDEGYDRMLKLDYYKYDTASASSSRAPR